MRWFYDLKIASKLNAMFAVILLFIVGLGTFSVMQLGEVYQSSTDLSRNWLPTIQTLSRMGMAMSRARSFDLQHLLTSDPKEHEYLEKNAVMELAMLAEQTKLYESQITEPREREIFPEVKQAVQQYQEIHGRIARLAAEGKLDAAAEIMNQESTPLFRKTISQIEELIDVNNKGAQDSDERAEHMFGQGRKAIVAALVVIVVLALGLAQWMARLVARPLSNAVAIARQVAQGDLTTQIQSASKDETGQLLDALKTMNGNLLSIVREVRSGTDTIATASSEIASGNMDLSARTEQQAGSLEETASAMEELTSTVRQNADNARQANQLAVSASEAARAGGSVVGQVVDTMGAINDSSRKIVDIIDVIDGIAFQTNILALNAAVEAARAGEQGRGFAVVASEVRTLAQRSAAAARQIKELIDDSVAKVDTGSKLVHEAGNTMQEVVASVRRVTDIVGEIAAASHEQQQGIEQIGGAVAHMDEATQQNAALVEQAAAAANALQEQAARLSQTVGVFRLDTQGAAFAPAGNASRQQAPQDLTPPRPAIGGQPAKAGGDAWEQF